MKHDTQTPSNALPTPSTPAAETRPLPLKTGVKAGGLLLPAVQKVRG